MNQTIDAFFYAYENAKIREVSHRSLDDSSDWIFSLASSQGLAMTCFSPKEIRRWPDLR